MNKRTQKSPRRKKAKKLKKAKSELKVQPQSVEPQPIELASEVGAREPIGVLRGVWSSDPEQWPREDWTSERVLQLRNKLGLTQEQFAHRLGVTYVTVNRWENSRCIPKGLSLEALRRMAVSVQQSLT